MTREEILANRMKWVKFLKQPKRKKAIGVLDSGGGHRCCLGHGCYVLGVERRPNPFVTNAFLYGEDFADTLAPDEFVEMVGLYDEEGHPLDTGPSLAARNDSTKMTPQQIGAWIEERITGEQPDSPFKPLSSYPEEK